jgi:phosphohistidine phosphatase SixA
MKLALIRHGQAENHLVDDLRKLTPLGIEQAQSTGKFLGEQSFKTTEFIHSPLTRAQQTCLLIQKELDSSLPITINDELKPQSPLSFWTNELAQREQNLILVGHNPFMSLLAQQLSGSPQGFPTGGCVILERSQQTEHWNILAINF